VPMRDYPRYENRFVRTDFDPTEVHVTAAGHELSLHWPTAQRSVR